MHNVLTFTPSAFIEVLRDVTVKSGHHLRLQCKLSSLPTHPLTVTWTKNQHAIENYDNIRLVKDGVTYALDITQTETADTGHYRCSVTCGSRRITCSANVAVLGKSKCCQIRYPLLLNVKWHKLLQNVWDRTSSEMRKEHSSFLCPRRLNFDLRRESRTLTSTFRSLFSEFRSPTIVSRSRLIFYFQLPIIKRLLWVDHRNVEPKLGPNSFGVKYVPRLTVAKGKRGP